jgi:AraC-like DNA-binding protein
MAETQKIPISWLLDTLESLGMERKTLLSCAGISWHEDLAEEDLRASVDEYNAIYTCASLTLKEPAVGLKIARRVTAKHMGLVTLLGDSCSTLMQSWINLCRYQATFASEFCWSMQVNQTRAKLIYELKGADSEQSRGDIELSLALAMSRLKRLASFDAREFEACFSFISPADTSVYEEVFGPLLTFQAECNSLSVPTDLLEARLPESDSEMSRILESRARVIIDDLTDKPDLIKKVETTIALCLGSTAMSIETVARTMFMHPRTLHRKLIQHGTSFRQIKDQVVVKAAQEALLSSSLNLTEIAHNLGFSENSAFSRTFKRVCDVTPSAYREIGREVIY